MIALDYSVFGLGALYFAAYVFLFFRVKDPRARELLKFESQKSQKLSDALNKGAFWFLVFGLLFLYAGLRADLGSLWMITASIFILAAMALGFTSFLQKRRNLPKRESPNFLPDDWLKARLKARWISFLLRTSLFVVWVYSWQDLVAL